MRVLAPSAQRSGFGGIARHSEAGRDCRICEHGAGAYGPKCLCSDALAHRAHLLEGAGSERQTTEDLEPQEQDRARRQEEAAQLDRKHPGLGASAADAPEPVPVSWARAAGR